MSVNFSDLLPTPAKVELPNGKSFEVSGLSLEQVAALMATNFEVIATFMVGDTLDFKAFVLKSPEVAASVIAAGADAHGQEESIRKLPFQVQLDALSQIWNLTVPDVKKLKELLAGATAALNENAGPAKIALSEKS